jgi:PAS domain S-box-containing protein
MDALVQTCIVGGAISLAGAAIGFYLWSEQRAERYLLFWTLAWITGLIRWCLHYPAESNTALRALEGFNIAGTLFFMILGSYDLLPNKPWRDRNVIAATALILVACAAVAQTLRQPLEVGYALFAATLAFCGACMWVGYRSTRLTGYAFAAGTFVYEFLLVGILLVDLGRKVANSVIVPLWNIPLVLSIVVIAYQRHRRKLVESEHALQTIFETAPTPIVIVRPPEGQIERANRLAFDMLGLSTHATFGRTAVEQGVAVESPMRRAIYTELESGRRVKGQEMVVLRAGRDERTLSVNADRITLDAGDRYIFSFHDVTELRRAEKDLRESAEQLRQLYVRLANVEEDERRALHAELHDQVGANLSALRLQLDMVGRLVARNEGAAAAQHLDSARQVATATAAIARDLMAELRPPALDDYGLVAALRTLAESQSGRLNLQIDVTGEDQAPRPSLRVEGALFRIAHEAVINAARHASASRVTVDIDEADGRVVLTVADDGVGFDLARPGVGPDHWGLKNMRERARAIGGVLRIETAPGAGTRVVADAPREGT